MSLIEQLKMKRLKVNQEEVLKATIFGVNVFLSFEGEVESKIEKAVQTFKEIYSSQPDHQAELT